MAAPGGLCGPGRSESALGSGLFAGVCMGCGVLGSCRVEIVLLGDGLCDDEPVVIEPAALPMAAGTGGVYVAAPGGL